MAPRRFCECGCRRLVTTADHLAPRHARQPVTCGCGCGQSIAWQPYFAHRRPRYIRGHRSRTIDHTIKPPAKWPRPSGFCGCGCGQRTAIAKQTSITRGHYRGYHKLFARGHNASTTLAYVLAPGRWLTRNGYVVVNSPSGGHRHEYEHRVVMSKFLQRPLARHEYVHHRNGNRADNSPGNLELWLHKDPPGQRITDLVTWAREIIARYGAMFPEP